MSQSGRSRAMALRLAPPGPVSAAVIGLLFLALPLAYLAAVTPPRHAAAVAGAAATPLLLAAGLRLPLGALLAVALVSPPLAQFVIQGTPEGIPVAAVMPLFGVEAVLLLRGASLLRSAPRPRVVEVLFLAAIVSAAVVGLRGANDPRVWLAELAETANIVVVLWLLRLNGVGFRDLRLTMIVGHVIAAPFFVAYLVTSFGEYRTDFFFGLTWTLVPVTVGVLLQSRVSTAGRLLLGTSCLVMLITTAAAGVRGTTLIALLATGLVVLFSLRRLPAWAMWAASVAVVGLVAFHPSVIRLAESVAPEAAERFRSAAQSPTLSVRMLEAEDAFAAFREQPAGRGLGAVLVTRHELVWGESGVAIHYGPTTYIHNSYAWYLAKTGIAGLLALAALAGSAVAAAARRLSTAPGAPIALALLLASLAGAWGGPALHNVFLTSWVALALYFARDAEDVRDAARAEAAGLAVVR